MLLTCNLHYPDLASRLHECWISLAHVLSPTATKPSIVEAIVTVTATTTVRELANFTVAEQGPKAEVHMRSCWANLSL